MNAEDGVDMEDTTFLYGDPNAMDAEGDSDMMNALMDAFQVAGVDAVLASRCACALIKQG